MFAGVPCQKDIHLKEMERDHVALKQYKKIVFTYHLYLKKERHSKIG